MQHGLLHSGSPSPQDPRRNPDGVLKMVPFWDSHSKASFGVLWASECVPWPTRCSKRVPNGGPNGVQNELKSMVPTKKSKMWFRTLFATFQPCPPCLKTLALGTVLGHLSGVPREVNKRIPLKHTSQGAHGHLGGPKGDFRVPEGSHLAAKSFKTVSSKTCPVPWSAKAVPRWPPEAPRSQN